MNLQRSISRQRNFMNFSLLEIRKLVPVLIFAILLVGKNATAATLRVPQQFPDINTANSNAAPGDTIVVTGGSYGELIIIEDSINFVGRLWPEVDSIVVNASSVTIQGFRTEKIGLLGFSATIEGNRVGNGGIVMEGFAGGSRIEGNRIRSGNTAILLDEGVDSVTIIRNRISGGQIGINILSDGNTIFGNWITGTPSGGIVLAGDGNGVDSNLVTGSGFVGVEWDNFLASANVLTRNQIFGSVDPEAALWLGGLSNTAAVNTIRGARGHGILVSGIGGHTARRNVIGGVGDDGIKIRDDIDETTHNSQNNLIDNNTIIRSGSDGIDCENPNNTIMDNQVSLAGDNGIEFGPEGSDNTITGNRVWGSGICDLNDKGGDNDYSFNIFLQDECEED